MIRTDQRIKHQPSKRDKNNAHPEFGVKEKMSVLHYRLIEDRSANKEKNRPCQPGRDRISCSIPGNRYFAGFTHARVITLLPIFSRIWCAISIAIKPSTSVTTVLVLLSMASLNDLSSSRMALTSGI